MADGTHIEWTDATWNPVTGCSIVSKGCTNCYAMKLAGTRLQHHPSRAGLTRETKAGPVWTGEVRFNEQWLDQPLRWRKPRKIFVCAHGDLFAEGVPDEWIDRVFAVMALAGSLPSLSGLRPSPPLAHTFQVLTKRPERMRAYITAISRNPIPRLSDNIAAHMGKNAGATKLFAHLRSVDLAEEIARFIDPDNGGWPLPNVWLGVSAEDQATADARIPELLATPAAVRFVSAEPLLGPIDFAKWLPRVHHHPDNDLSTLESRAAIGAIIHAAARQLGPQLDWIIVGGESGTGARPMHPDWARSIRDQCQAASVAFLFKQWGAWVSTYDRDRDDPDWRRVPKAGDWDRKRFLNQAGGQGFHGQQLHLMRNVGKAAAGRLLDGRTWDEFPQLPHAEVPGLGAGPRSTHGRAAP